MRIYEIRMRMIVMMRLRITRKAEQSVRDGERGRENDYYLSIYVSKYVYVCMYGGTI